MTDAPDRTSKEETMRIGRLVQALLVVLALSVTASLAQEGPGLSEEESTQGVAPREERPVQIAQSEEPPVEDTWQSGPLVTNYFYDTDLREALRDISAQTGINIIPDDTVQGLVTLEVYDMPLEECLRRMLNPLGYTFREKEGYYVVGAPHPQNPSFPLLTETTLYSPNYISAEDVARLLSDYYVPYVKINTSTHTVAITASPEMTQSVLEDLAKIDVAPRQVMIEAIVTEMSETAARTLGLDWSLDGNDGGSSVFNVRNTPPGRADTSLYFTFKEFNRTMGDYNVTFEATLRALEDDGEIEIRANPRLATVNGRPASIFIGREEYYSIVTGPLSYPYTKLELIQVGITLEVTPYVSAKDEITVAIKPEVSDVTGQGASDLPVVSKRSVDTKLRVDNGETITVGGLTLQSENVSVTGVPFLSRIPLLGYLFKQETVSVEEREIVVFITPRIINE
jgi:type II secretory pathway component GspD/PulD (secretin)